MNNLAKQSIQRMTPYAPPIEGRRSYAGWLLDFNERTVPYGVIAQEAIQLFARENRMQYYPEYDDLKDRIGAYVNTKPENILITNGSDQGIDIIFRTFTDKTDEVIIPSPSFAMFYQCATLSQNTIITPTYSPLSGSFPLDNILKAITKQTKLIIICNPNNPTGTLVSLTDIETILKKAKDAIVYVDEAYAEYTGVSAVSLVETYANLVITRTFSKAFGLASLRIGYVIANEVLINEMKKVIGPYDVNMAGVYAVNMAMKDLSPLNRYVKEVMTFSKPMLEEFFLQESIPFYQSAADFILFKPKNPEQTFACLKNNGFLTRPRKGYGFDGTIRVTAGTKKQTKSFIQTYRDICKI